MNKGDDNFQPSYRIVHLMRFFLLCSEKVTSKLKYLTILLPGRKLWHIFHKPNFCWVYVSRDEEQLPFKPSFSISHAISTCSVRQQECAPQIQATAVTAAGVWQQQLIKSAEAKVWITLHFCAMKMSRKEEAKWFWILYIYIYNFLLYF